MSAHDWITNRELATLIWGALTLGVATVWSRTRPCLKTIATAIITPPLVTIIIYTGIACFGGMLLFEPEDGWSNRLRWISFFWFFTVGLRLSFKVIALEEPDWQHVFRHIAGVYTATAVFDFIINFGSLSLALELLLVPAVFISLYIVNIRINNTDHGLLASVGSLILSAIGVALVFVSGVAIFSDWSTFISVESARAFYVPFMLSLCVSPIVILVFTVSNYQRILGSAQFAIKDERLLQYARVRAIVKFNLNITALERWRHIIHSGNTTTRAELDETISAALRSTSPMDSL